MVFLDQLEEKQRRVDRQLTNCRLEGPATPAPPTCFWFSALCYSRRRRRFIEHARNWANSTKHIIVFPQKSRVADKRNRSSPRQTGPVPPRGKDPARW